LEKDPFYLRGLALGGAAVILFERYEQKDKSGTPGPPFLAGNAQIKKIKNIFIANLYLAV
jgi:hypothetical protein